MADSKVEPLLSVFENDPEMGEIVALFVAEMPERAGELRKAIEQRDLEAATRIAHQLKGAAGGYGFETLGDIAKAAERALHALADTPSATRREALMAASSSLLEACGRVRLSTPQAAA